MRRKIFLKAGRMKKLFQRLEHRRLASLKLRKEGFVVNWTQKK